MTTDQQQKNVAQIVQKAIQVAVNQERAKCRQILRETEAAMKKSLKDDEGEFLEILKAAVLAERKAIRELVYDAGLEEWWTPRLLAEHLLDKIGERGEANE